MPLQESDDDVRLHPGAQRTCARAPCKSCPYRTDVPSGIWHATEYAKLSKYDGEIADQVTAGAVSLFLCHQQDGRLCAGWVGAHGAHNLLALRIHGRKVHANVWDYQSPVPLFSSGAEAAAHGLRDIQRPKSAARRMAARLSRDIGSTPRRRRV